MRIGVEIVSFRERYTLTQKKPRVIVSTDTPIIKSQKNAIRGIQMSIWDISEDVTTNCLGVIAHKVSTLPELLLISVGRE